MDFAARDVQSEFLKIFKREPLMVRAPGRINLIGEHTDYNSGFVMPAAINKEIFFAVAPSGDARSVIYSPRYEAQFEVNLDDLRPVREPGWANYFLGVLHQFREKGFHLAPFSCVFAGNVPVGAGLSSSAALECGFAFAIADLHRHHIPPMELISMALWAEHHYAGVRCGIMDQFASVMGRQGNAMLLDCRSLSHAYIPLDLRDHQLILCDTKVKHSLVDSEYNTRREECEEGVRLIQKHHPEIGSLRDVTPALLARYKTSLPGKVYQRCLYVVQEIARVQDAAHDLRSGDLRAFGKKMFETHDGLSLLYEVSCPELDMLAAEAKKWAAVEGARMMGGGFGGCTLNLVRRQEVEAFSSAMQEKYRAVFHSDLAIYNVSPADGVGRVDRSVLDVWA